MLGPEDAEDEDIKAEILQEASTCGAVEQVRPTASLIYRINHAEG